MASLSQSVYFLLCLSQTNSFWDFGTTTPFPARDDLTPRQSFFRWQKSIPRGQIIYGVDSGEVMRRKRLYCIAGISIDKMPLSTAVILNKRVLITAANFLEPHLTRQRDIRVWALGHEGQHITPYRYRVWKVRRLFPKSDNPEHFHGIRGRHVPRHDVAIIHTMDQMYLSDYLNLDSQRAVRALMPDKHHTIFKSILWYAGSGYEYPLHIRENYKIFYTNVTVNEIVNCERYLPKWWGKFVCVKNLWELTGLQNGGGLFTTDENIENDIQLMGIGCFEIRYNEDRILAFTDLRYYADYVSIYANITVGEYYEYSYQIGGVPEIFWSTKQMFIPKKYIATDFYPLG